MKIEKLLFSVIIPVYNTRDYLPMAIESVLKQDCTDYEIIVIDDDSSDGSREVVKGYEKRGEIIATYNEKNQGLSAARNQGIEMARGEYIVFLDSDDYFSRDALSNFRKKIEEYDQPDIIAGHAYRLNGTCISKKRGNKSPIVGVMKGRDFLEDGYRRDYLFACSQFYIYRRDFIEEKNLRFKEGLVHEDELFTPKAMICAQRVVDGDFEFYYHRNRPGSISNKREKKHVEDIRTLCKELEQFLEDRGESPKNTCYLRDHMAVLYMSATSVGLENHFLDVKTANSDKNFPFRNAKRRMTIGKAIIYAGSPRVYVFLKKGLTKIKKAWNLVSKDCFFRRAVL